MPRPDPGRAAAAGRALRFPLHWAEEPAVSFVASAADYRRALERAGFEVVKERNRGDFARTVFNQAMARAAGAGGPPPLSMHLLLKRDAVLKLANVTSNVEQGLIAPTELICRAR